jgi:hypothetical protein
MHGGTAAIIDRFYDAWNRKNAAALREPFAADGRYADPLARGDLVGKQLTDRPNPGTRSTRAGAAENVLPSKPGDRKVGGFGISRLLRYSSMPSLRSAMIAALRQRTVSGENDSVNGGIPFARRSGLPSRRTR